MKYFTSILAKNGLRRTGFGKIGLRKLPYEYRLGKLDCGNVRFGKNVQELFLIQVSTSSVYSGEATKALP